ncbi:MAG: ferritin [Gemmatimonadota bacterium]
MRNQKVVDALNRQVGEEFYAAYLYLAMMAYFERSSLPGFAHWMRLQAQEEVGHAMRLVDFILERGGRVELGPIDKPPSEFDSPLSVMREALEHERGVTEQIHELYEVALEQKDYPAQVLLQWFITEQVEEEKSAGDLVDRLELAGDSGSALLVLDEKLGARTAGG